MDDLLPLRRHLYEQLARGRHGRRTRRALSRQILLLGAATRPDDDGPSGVREPRRPRPPRGPASRTFS